MLYHCKQTCWKGLIRRYVLIALPITARHGKQSSPGKPLAAAASAVDGSERLRLKTRSPDGLASSAMSRRATCMPSSYAASPLDASPARIDPRRMSKEDAWKVAGSRCFSHETRI